MSFVMLDDIGAFYYVLRKENFTAIPGLNAAIMILMV